MKSASEAYAKRHKLMQTEEQQVSIHKVDKPFNCATCSKLSARCLTIQRFKNILVTYEPRHEISNNVVYATSKASDQPAHMHSLIRAFASRSNIL